ncbi:glycosyltransferase family 4 protein [Arthrobacter sp. KBS0703]|uniref:glycosyltransferase family 4 protein n=1 Tax=Arthrobacter sp. KBS0703 TaxID=1955698 RepID=UPI00099013B4|nr:glycosyltransferase family 4 protein [Arthrobacter sp. KBS0703]TSE14719.1 glycosyltransferase family 4 protein [Arthrobacter sp. KBS0703]
MKRKIRIQTHDQSHGKEKIQDKTVVILQEYVPQYRIPFFRQLIKLGSENGIQIRVAAGTPNEKQYLRQDGHSASFIQKVPQREFSIAGVRLVLRHVGPAIRSADLVIMEQARRNIDAYWLLLAPHGNRKICLWGHGRDFVATPSWFKKRAMTHLTQAADWFFGYTEGSRDAVVAEGYPVERTTVVRNSIDTTDFQNSISQITPAEVDEFKRLHNLHRSTAIFIGGLDESKRLPFLFQACGQAHEQNHDFRLLVAGSGQLRDYVEGIAKDAPWLTYLGPLFGKDKALAVASSDLICMPGRVGLVAVDSFAAGRPIVTTAWPWHAPEFEYLAHNETCLITEDDSSSYAQGLHRLMENRVELESMQEACRNNRATYSIEQMASRFFEGIQLALAS